MEVSNYMLVNVKGLITTPFELVHHQKPNLHALIPLFSVAYIDHPMTNVSSTESMAPQTLRTILIGKSDETTAFEFYHPPSKQIFSSAVYRLDTTLAAGPIFNLHYDGGLFFNTYYNEADANRPPQFTVDQQVFFQPNQQEFKYIPAKILAIPLDSTNIYTLQRNDNLNIIQMPEQRIKNHNPTATVQNHIDIQDTALPTWIK